MTLVPEGEKLVAEVWVSNEDVGFVRAGQEAKLKLATFQFQKYGMIQGRVLHVNADATEAPSPNVRQDVGRERPMGPLAFRALVELASQQLSADGQRYALQPGHAGGGRDPSRHAHGHGVPAFAGAESVSRSRAGALS